MIKRLVEMNKPVLNDERQNKYCHYITLFLSHFGGERCMVAGSTQELTRLRIRQDEGDYDYLVMSEIIITVDALEYRDDLPCFVHINGLRLKDKFPTVALIDDRYLPSSLLSDLRPEAFRHIRDFYHIFTRFGTRRGSDSLHVSLDHRIKPGKTLVSYRDVECPELGIENTKNKDSKNILEYFYSKMEEESFDGKDEAILNLGKLIDVINQFQNIDNDKNKVESIFVQTFGSVIDALAGNDVKHGLPKHEFDTEKSKRDETPLVQKDGELDTCKDGASETECRHSMYQEHTQSELTTDEFCNYKKETTGNALEKKSSCNGSDRSREKEENIILKYRSKASKDFIPAFPISGKPKFLNDWKNRERHWPLKNVVDDIYNSEFFVVAKPALTNQDKAKDFCLAYNNAEIKLARSMTPVQKKVVLIIKAIKKCLLNEYSEILTTFHWKTAVYWKSENLDSSMLQDTTENVLNLFLIVLEHMIDCLHRQELYHFFIPSNLFAGMDQNVASEIATKIQRIRKEPITSLRIFFEEQNLNKWKYETIPREKVEQFRQAYNDPRDSSNIDIIVSILRRFSNEKTETVKQALRDVLKDSLPFLIEEEAGGRNSDDIINSALLKIVLSNSRTLFERLIDRVISFLMEEVDMDVKDIGQTFLKLILKEILKK